VSSNQCAWLLTVLAVISNATADLQPAIVIGLMVLISTFMHFIREARSNRAADELKAMVSNRANVRRSHVRTGATRQFELPISELVPGDILKLSAGDMIPADVRLLSAKALFVSQAALTGESPPVAKHADRRDRAESHPLQQPHQ
ncbi:magnesium-translocating P-type ATPase, partial [Plesiomonas shigelloides]|nr:magnesium-translocating P-type ATPase [Plesiomonas shigelloides]